LGSAAAYESESVSTSSDSLSGCGGGGAAAGCPDGAADASCGVRSDSLATTIVMAAARTARPASCPPMRRGSSGKDEAVDVALVTRRFPCRELTLGEGLGVTTGNKLEMLPGVTVVPGSPGTVGGSDPVPGGTVGEELAWSSTVATVASAGDSAPPDAFVTP